MKIMLPLLETERLFLTPWSVEFAEDMLLFASNPNVAPVADWAIIKTKTHAEIKISILRNRCKNKGSLEWAIVLKDNFKAIGSIGLHLKHDKKELYGIAGYLLAEEYWGRGICTEALGKIVHYAFMGLKIETFNIMHRRFNLRSKRVIEKCGFIYYDYSPHDKPDEPDNLMLYKLTRDEYYKNNNYPEALRSRDVYRINYSEADINDYNNSITYQKQPTIYQCGQACVAMLAGVTPQEVAEIMFEEYGTGDCDIDQALNYYRIPHANLRKRFLPGTILPDICILSMAIPGDSHWSLYRKGKFYDPQFGVSDKCPENCEILYYWEIYNDGYSEQRFYFYLPSAKNSYNAPKSAKNSPYGVNKPVRVIDSISYIKQPDGCLCGQTCVAMLAGVSVNDVLEIMDTDEGTKKQDLKKALDYYGIRYAPKSARYDASIPLPDLCIIRMKLPGYGHWGIFYNGVYYDPEFGVLSECPSNAVIFQVWEIYP